MKLLINFVYYPPVGHVIEAIKYARGFKDYNKKLEIHLALNSSSPYEIAKACPWIKRVYTIDVEGIEKHGKKEKSFKNIPKKWDYIISDTRSIRLGDSDYEQKMKKYYELFNENSSAKKWKGLTNSWKNNELPKELI